MAERAALIEALDEIENGMCRIAETRDIWQNNLLYALCQGVRLLLVDKLRETHRKPAMPKSNNNTMNTAPDGNVTTLRPELQKAIELLEKNYERGLGRDFVRDPVAWALYQTWKEIDGGTK